MEGDIVDADAGGESRAASRAPGILKESGHGDVGAIGLAQAEALPDLHPQLRGRLGVPDAPPHDEIERQRQPA